MENQNPDNKGSESILHVLSVLNPDHNLFQIRTVDVQVAAVNTIGRWLCADELTIVENNLRENISKPDVLDWAIQEVVETMHSPRKKKF